MNNADCIGCHTLGQESKNSGTLTLPESSPEA
jgi:hypothetical protein